VNIQIAEWFGEAPGNSKACALATTPEHCDIFHADDDAFWQDVLNDPYHGTTDAYTLVNAAFGFRWADDKVTTSIKIVNLANSDVQQHVFGDITKRQIMGEVKVRFPR